MRIRLLILTLCGTLIPALIPSHAPFLGAVSAATLSTTATAILPRESRVPGGVALVPLTGITGSTAPQVRYNTERVLVIPNPQPGISHWLAVVGIPVDAEFTQPQTLELKDRTFTFSIQDKAYRAQYLTVKNQRHVDPDPEDIARWTREKDEMNAAFRYWSEPASAVLKFSLPADGPFSSPFGLKRFFNQQPRNPHSGLDIAAPQGAPVRAPAPGTVRATGNYFFNGNTVILDHGFGVTSLYCHLSRIDVKPGDRLDARSLIGLVGKTGRVTGAHLHWSVSLNNVRVDPQLFVDAQ